VAAALASVLAGAAPAMAGFVLGGYAPQVVQSDQGVDSAATYFQTVRTWDVSGTGAQVNTSFTLPANEAILFARLYLDVYGGTNAHTAQVAVTVNGHALSPISIGGTSDANPTFDATKTCVYGSGVGQWQLAIAGIVSFLDRDGAANTIGVLVTDPNSTNFDGRMVDVGLVAVYQDPSINQKLDYYLAEGDGYLRRPPPNPTYGNAPAQRQVAISGVDTVNVTSAHYTTLYTHGDAGQADRQYFNGTQLGGNDVAYGQYGTYGPDLPTFDVSGYLSANSTVLYDVNTVGNTAGETSMLAKIGLLEVTHPMPEPTTMGALGLGALAFLLKKRRQP
jgi:hypothetical protein